MCLGCSKRQPILKLTPKRYKIHLSFKGEIPNIFEFTSNRCVDITRAAGVSTVKTHFVHLLYVVPLKVYIILQSG